MPLTEEERKALAEELSVALRGYADTLWPDPTDDFTPAEERWVAAFRRQHYEENGIDWRSVGL